MVSKNLFNIGSCNGLLLSGSKQLLEPMLTHHQWRLVAFTWRQFHRSDQAISSWYGFRNKNVITAPLCSTFALMHCMWCYIDPSYFGMWLHIEISVTKRGDVEDTYIPVKRHDISLKDLWFTWECMYCFSCMDSVLEIGNLINVVSHSTIIFVTFATMYIHYKLQWHTLTITFIPQSN